MRGFSRRGEVAVATLDTDERAVIAAFFAQVDSLLDASSLPGGSPTTEDPALLRLFPNAAPTDREVADEYRRLAEHHLRSLKTERLRRIQMELHQEGPEWVVPLEEALPTAAALTDVRLVIATRLGLKTDDDAELLHSEMDMAQGLLEQETPEGLSLDHERISLVMLYQALTWLQDSLVACVMDQEGGGDE